MPDKAATLAVQSAAGDGEKKYGTGLRATVNRINKEMLNSPHDKKLTKSTIYKEPNSKKKILN